MLFNDLLYIFFFLPFATVFANLLKKLNINLSKVLVILLSLLFYAFLKIEYLPLIIFSLIFNYFIVSFFHNNLHKKFLLFICISVNIFILGYFKYKNFLIENINFIFDTNFILAELSFPLSLSFLTFQQISFAVDSYNSKKKIKFIDYFLCVLFFPHFIAGPILKYDIFVKELKTNFCKINYNYLSLGIILISVGIFKKSFLADNLSIFVNRNYINISNLNFFETWLTNYAWAFQFYFDFSGYVDIALGSALLLSIKLPINFNSPYKATNVIDFWQRWHITLGKFFNTYIYYPLIRYIGDVTLLKSSLVIFFIFLLSGIWHGPNYTFIIFGILNGIAVVFNYFYKNYIKIKLNNFCSIFFTFNYITFTLMFFRSSNLNESIIMMRNMLNFSNFLNELEIFFEKIYYIKFEKSEVFFGILLIISFITIFFLKNSNEIKLTQKNLNSKVISYIILGVIGVLSIKNKLTFIYFEF